MVFIVHFRWYYRVYATRNLICSSNISRTSYVAIRIIYICRISYRLNAVAPLWLLIVLMRAVMYALDYASCGVCVGLWELGCLWEPQLCMRWIVRARLCHLILYFICICIICEVNDFRNIKWQRVKFFILKQLQLNHACMIRVEWLKHVEIFGWVWCLVAVVASLLWNYIQIYK